jgi:hypothetical protein
MTSNQTPPALEVIDVLGGFVRIDKRSAILDGSVSQRAARGCPPFLEGNAAGFHLRLADPAYVTSSDEGLRLHLSPRAAEIFQDNQRALQAAIAGGLLVKGSAWHRRLARGVAVTRGDTLSLWTGLLARPARGRWLLQTRAFNRSVQVGTPDVVLPDATGFVPVILDLDFSGRRGIETWLDSELCCLLPVQPDVSIDICSIDDRPSVGEAFNRFYTTDYLEKRSTQGATGRYRAMCDRQPSPSSTAPAACELIVAGGPSFHRRVTFRRFATLAGVTATHPEASRLQFAVVRNQFAVRGCWDLHAVRDLEADVGIARNRLLHTWARLYGPDAVSTIEWITDYAGYPPAPIRDEPVVLLMPFVFMKTPDGWSSVSDGFDHGILTGMRGVIATDRFHFLAPAMRLGAPAAFTLARGTPIERVLPVPADLLRAPCLFVSLDGTESEIGGQPARATPRPGAA